MTEPQRGVEAEYPRHERPPIKLKWWELVDAGPWAHVGLWALIVLLFVLIIVSNGLGMYVALQRMQP